MIATANMNDFEGHVYFQACFIGTGLFHNHAIAPALVKQSLKYGSARSMNSYSQTQHSMDHMRASWDLLF